MITSRRSGFTIVELIAAVSVLGLTAAVVGLAGHKSDVRPSVDDVNAQIRSVRLQAINSRRAVTLEINIGVNRYHATALPDGRIIGDSALGGYNMNGRNDVAR